MVTMWNILDNPNIEIIENKGPFSVIQHKESRSCEPEMAMTEYYMGKMGLNKRQLLCDLDDSGVKLQAGAMQWMAGDIESSTDVADAKEFAKNCLKALGTWESAVKPLYWGTGQVMLEPSYNHILIEDVASWGKKGLVLTDGMFLACQPSVKEKVIMRTNLSSVFGGKGLFNLSLVGSGYCALESFVPRDELFMFELDDDTVKIDGNMAMCWSGTLEFTVERSSKSLLGSMINGEGLVNVYRGTGKILMAPTIPGTIGAGAASLGSDAKGAIKGVGQGILETIKDVSLS